MQSRSEAESGDCILITREEKRALEYLGNVGNDLLTGKFDEDFEPIGPTLREQLTQKGLVVEFDGWIGLRLDLLQTLVKSDPSRQIERKGFIMTHNPQDHLVTSVTIFFSNELRRWIIRASCKVSHLVTSNDEPTDKQLKDMYNQDIEIIRKTK